jgi:hypothetical protein
MVRAIKSNIRYCSDVTSRKWMKGQSLCMLLAGAVCDRAQLRHTWCPEGPVHLFHACKSLEEPCNYWGYNLCKVPRTILPYQPVTTTNASHIRVTCSEYCGLWYAQLLIQVSVPATYWCKKTVSKLVSAWHPSWQLPNEEYLSIMIILVVKCNLFFFCKPFTCLREQSPIQFHLTAPRAKYPRCRRCTKISQAGEKLSNKTWLSGSSTQSSIFRKNLGSHPFYR